MPKAPTKKPSLPHFRRERVVVAAVSPAIDGGRFPIKRVVGDEVVGKADVFADGHDLVSRILCVRRPGRRALTESRMTPLGNDRFRGVFAETELGTYTYTVQVHIERFGSFCQELERRPLDAPDLETVWAYGASLIAQAVLRAKGVIVNLGPYHRQSGWLERSLWR